ncbi:pyridoxamine 5'-phosphate oxidase family protein [Winogradskyella marincola]|uniref:Pyridoxamine 5'-phosphate oxidase family protein n=1 Tax=Winogradskyella marincola TaxID=3037795 RepID=A0ABT6G311_9FLAO|nr:pyridoxamine 5'-phosphate oxidase family protein [Winogradskyella sp. YYF002]MDG4716434.1 pyridoxamine 5'-phosphate oxidase family protein [Winogradskyella sp. YYF002]
MIKNLEHKRSSEILKNNYIGYLSYISGNRPYTIPITYYYNDEENYIICYSGNGHKIRSMRRHTSISMTVTDIYSNNKWQSVMVHGQYKEAEGSTSKLYLHEFSLGIKNLVLKKEHKDLDYISQFSSKTFNMETPIVFLLNIDDITGKVKS